MSAGAIEGEERRHHPGHSCDAHRARRPGRFVSPRAAARTALGLDVVVALILLSGVALLVANRSVFDGNTAFLFGLFGATAIAYSVAGTLIARRQPSNAVGWLMFATA